MNAPLGRAAGLCLAVALTACGSDHDDTVPAEPISAVSVGFSTDMTTATPFPSDRFTVEDRTQRSQRRVALPKLDCTVQVSDCEDIDVLNTLDGFSVWPRVTVPFTGDIDPASVSSESVYLWRVGPAQAGGSGARVGINQVAWDPSSRTLSFKSDALLQEHTAYLLVITDRVKDTAGLPISGGDWLTPGGAAPAGPSGDTSTYRRDLQQALADLPSQTGGRAVAASLFTTQSATQELVQMARQTKAAPSAPIDFGIAERAGVRSRAVFPVAGLQEIVLRRHTGTAPQFTNAPVQLESLNTVPGSVGRVAYGRYTAPAFMDEVPRIAPVGTAQPGPFPIGTHDVVVQIFLPAGPRPAAGWPVVIFGHGFNDSMFGSPWSVASVFASEGLATASIHVVGHGGGPLGTLRVRTQTGVDTIVPVPGRGVDQNGDGSIAATEGSTAQRPLSALGARDALRQTVIDLVQLVHQFEQGVDVDGDGVADIDPARIYYSGQSFGGVYGTMLAAVEPGIAAAAPNVGGGSLIEATRRGGFQGIRAASLAARTPSLLNLPSTPGGAPYEDNLPFRNEAIRTTHVPGAMAIAQAFENSDWAQQSGVATAYAPLLRARPLPGRAPLPFLYLLAKGDNVMTNPSSTLVVRGGGLADVVALYRYGLAFEANPAIGRNPHGYLVDIHNPASRVHALAAQRQIATFLSSQGRVILDPDEGGDIFAVGIDPTELDALNFVP